MSTTLWLSPLILVPGVALLILSTSVRFNRLHDEIHLLGKHGEDQLDVLESLMRRGKLFRNALIALYLCVALFSLASLLGAVSEALPLASSWGTLSLLIPGIACLVFASVVLIAESRLSFRIIEAHRPRSDDGR